jgi:hypothetical protein
MDKTYTRRQTASEYTLGRLLDNQSLHTSLFLSQDRSKRGLQVRQALGATVAYDERDQWAIGRIRPFEPGQVNGPLAQGRPEQSPPDQGPDPADIQIR